MKVVDIANEIYLENASPTDTGIPAIAFWIRSNVGKLNTMLYESFYVDKTTQEIFKCDGWCIGPMAANILKLMFKVYRTDLDIRNMLVSVINDTVLKATDQEFSVEKVNKSELLKTLASIKKDTLAELNTQIASYRSYFSEPGQITGDDTVAGHYVGITDGYTRNVIGGGGDYSNGSLYDQYEAT